MWGILQRVFGDRFGQLARDQRGATAVEFALVAGPFFYVLGCIIETGLMLFTEYVIQSGVQEAARQVRTGQAQSAAMTADALKDVICETAGIIIDCAGSVYVYVNANASFATLDSALPSMLTVGPSVSGSSVSNSFDCGGPGEAATVIATYDWTFTLPFMDFFGNMGSDGTLRRLVGFAMFRNEPFPAGSTCG